MSGVLVTGASGFLGTALVKRLVDDVRYSPVASVRRKSSSLISGLRPILVGDLGASTDWTSALSDVDVVIHTAARVHVMNDSANDPLTEYRKVNFEGTLNLARQAVQTGIKRFIFISRAISITWRNASILTSAKGAGSFSHALESTTQ